MDYTQPLLIPLDVLPEPDTTPTPDPDTPHVRAKLADLRRLRKDNPTVFQQYSQQVLNRLRAAIMGFE
ncbi:MAG TPA: hypothetical protein VHL11_17400 [Phototrophicaceae bacterium]|jgi:hypothetical protein|nr:hypothetical protein [Phototrophicaceae bacterium]